MTRKIRFVGQFSDPQVELQMIEIVKSSQRLLDDLEGAQQNILDIDEILQDKETKQGATTKANEAEQNAKDYADQAVDEVKPKGGNTSSRPSNPALYVSYFDTEINKPIWWTGSAWVDSGGTVV